jgi:hypothetical protein
MAITHAVIGDPHAKWSENLAKDNARFDALGQFIVDRKPDVVVCLGDFADCESLSSYDKGKKSAEGKRFLKDVEATIDAQERIFGPLNKYNATRRMYKEKQYKPRMVLLGGNHDEGRIEKAVQLSPEYDGFISLEALKYVEFGWEYVPYRTTAHIDGIAYNHHHPSGPMGRPIGGKNLAHKLIDVLHQSATVGHDHHLHYAVQTNASGKKLHGLCAGLFSEMEPSYAMDTHRAWWRGIVVKERVKDGSYEPQFITLDTLKRMY